MERIFLDGAAFTDKETTHALLKEKLALPDYYGNNLDALWDCLTTDFSDRMIIIQNPQLILKQLGRYGRPLLKVFRHIRKANPHIRIVFAYTL